MFEAFISGNLANEPQMKSTKSGKNVCNFTVAVHQQGRKDETVFIRVAAWGSLGEVCMRYLSKGRKVNLVAKDLAVSVYAGKDGTPKAQIAVTAEQVEFAGRMENDENVSTENENQEVRQEDGKKPHELSGFIEVDEDELPFE